MKRILFVVIILLSFPLSVKATEYVAPTVPSEAQEYIPPETDNFGDGLLFVLQRALEIAEPEIISASRQCGLLLICAIAFSVFDSFGGNHLRIIEITAVLSAGFILYNSSKTLIQLGAETVSELTDYGALLIPVLTSAMAAQGGVTTSAALYTATSVFSTVLMKLIVKLIVPLSYIYLAISIADNAIEEKMISKIKSTAKWFVGWALKTILYVFTGYITLTGVLSGSVDSSALKATKLTISGTIPVIGGILSDASETVLVSAGLMKNSAGIYGIFAVIAICIHPVVQIGVQYLLLKFTSFCAGIVGTKRYSSVIMDFSTVMGFILAITGAVCMMLLISIGCFMKGVT